MSVATFQTPNTHAARPSARLQLPFRFVDRDNGCTEVWFRIHYSDGQHSENMVELAGKPGSETARLYTPLANGIWELCQAYWKLEAEHDELCRQRDEAVSVAAVATGENEQRQRSQQARDAEERRREAKRKNGG